MGNFRLSTLNQHIEWFVRKFGVNFLRWLWIQYFARKEPEELRSQSGKGLKCIGYFKVAHGQFTAFLLS